MMPCTALSIRPDFVVATGRFQLPIHQGHIEYLDAARVYARHVGAPFVVLTGPLDSELRPTEPLRFVERRIVLSLLADLPERYILNQRGSPHGGSEAAADWAAAFFAPICSEWGTDLDAASMHLAVVRKECDIKDYDVGGEACHYSDLLARYCDRTHFEIFDLTGKVTRLDLSSSQLRVDLASHEDVLSPVVLAAHELRQNWPDVPVSAWFPVLRAVRDALGNRPGVPAEAVRQFICHRPGFSEASGG
jgi:hypothetical protein